MRTSLVVATVVASCTLWMHMAAPAAAQGRAAYSPFPGARDYYGPYNAAPYSAPTVSPYVNLGVNSNGLSNYQTLVRPMLDDREALQNQSANLQQLRQQLQMREALDAQSREPRGGSTQGRGPGWFNYSHYYKGLR